LNANRQGLAHVARRLYQPATRLGDTGLLAAPGWILDSPIDLADVQLLSGAEPVAPVLSSTERQTAQLRPLATVTKRYARYSHVVRGIEQPALLTTGCRTGWSTSPLTSAGRR